MYTIDIEKRPSEVRYFEFDLAPLLAASEGLQAVVTTVVEAGPVVADLPTVSEAMVKTEKLVRLRMAGGAVPSGRAWVDHILRVDCSTTLGQTVEGVFRLRVRAGA